MCGVLGCVVVFFFGGLFLLQRDHETKVTDLKILILSQDLIRASISDARLELVTIYDRLMRELIQVLMYLSLSNVCSEQRLSLRHKS